MVLFTNTNITPIWFYSLFSYLWVAPALIVSMYLGGSLMFPKKKWWIVGIFIVLGVIFEYFLFFQNANSFEFNLITPGEDLINADFKRDYYTFFFVVIFLLSALVLLGIGFLIKAKQATGDLRKKFIYLSIGFIVFVLCGALDSILTLPIAIGFVRVVMMTYALWMYLGLKS